MKEGRQENEPYGIEVGTHRYKCENAQCPEVGHIWREKASDDRPGRCPDCQEKGKKLQ